MVKQTTDPASPDQPTQPASAGFFTPVVSEAMPTEGGSYTRDPVTGELTRNGGTAPPVLTKKD